MKLYAGLATASLCIYTDAINNLFDALSCLLAAGGLRLASRGKSPAYPDGLGRAEDLAGFLMAVSVAFTGAYFAYRALDRFMYPRPVNYQVFHAVLLGATVPVKLAMGFAFGRLSRRSGSLIEQTIRTDSFSDCGVTAMTLLSFILSSYSGLRADAVFGLAISVVVIVNAFRLVLRSARRLLGRNDTAQNEMIQDILLSCGYTRAEVKTYAAGADVTAAAAVAGEGDEAAARAQVREKTGAELYLSGR